MNERQCKKVLVVETGQIFNTCFDASVFFNVSYQYVSKVIKLRNRTLKGFHLKFVNDSDYDRNKNCRKIRNIDTGTVYDSILEATEKCYISKTSIARALNGTQKTAAGYRWEYAD